MSRILSRIRHGRAAAALCVALLLTGLPHLYEMAGINPGKLYALWLPGLLLTVPLSTLGIYPVHGTWLNLLLNVPIYAGALYGLTALVVRFWKLIKQG